MVQMTIKNIENEILILDTTLDTNYLLSQSTQHNDHGRIHCEHLKAQKEHALEDAKRAHEDLEFQLMELEAKYESELEDIQNRLIKEQDNLLSAFKLRQTNLNEYDQQQTQMLMQVKAETECLEMERQKLIDQFKKQRAQLHQVERKLQKLLQNEENNAPDLDEASNERLLTAQASNSQSESSQSNSNDLQETPSPASSSVSLSSTNTSTENTTPPIQQQTKILDEQPIKELHSTLQQQLSKLQLSPSSHTQTQTPSRFLNPARYINPNVYLAQSQLYSNKCPSSSQKSQQYKKQLSQSFRDILENTLLINGFDTANTNQLNTLTNSLYSPTKAQLSHYPNKSAASTNQALIINNNCGNGRYVKALNQSTCSLNNNSSLMSPNGKSSLNYSSSILDQAKMFKDLDLINTSNINPMTLSQLPSTNLLDIDEDQVDLSYSAVQLSPKLPTTPVLVNNQLAIKFVELERKLEMSKAENNNLLEQQLQARERELKLLQEEKRKREELERQLNQEIHLREKIVEENIKLRDKKSATQARPLTRYLPVRDHNFDLKQHVENSGHNLMNQIDPNTRQPMILINKNSCRGYLLKMGQKFKTWNKRWFVFDRTKRTLCYYLDKHENKLRGSIYFQSINEVYVDHMRTIKSPDHKSTFVVKTHDRNFFFVAPSSELMRIWVDVIFTGAEGYLEFND